MLLNDVASRSHRPPLPYTIVVAPAVKGTKNVFNQAKKIPSVKRIVLTSSSYAMYTDARDIFESATGVLYESMWNETASMQYQPYAYGKTEAEKDAWEKLEKQDQWDLVTICPGLMVGPGVKCHRKSHPVSLVTNFGNGTSKRGVLELSVACVDVRDASRAHIEAAFRPDANGRYLVAPHETNYFQMSQILRNYYAEYEGGPEWPKGPSSKHLLWTYGPWVDLNRKFVSRNVGYPFKVDSSRSQRELKIKYRPLEESLQDMADQIIEEGLWDKARMAEEVRLFKEEEERIKEEKKEAKAIRKEIRLAKEADEKELAKVERAAEKEKMREDKQLAKEERLAEKERLREEKERLREEKQREREERRMPESQQEQAADIV